MDLPPNLNRFCRGVTHFLWHGTRPSYKHIKIWGVIVYISNGRVTRNNIDDISYCIYFMGYADTTRVILYWSIDHFFLSAEPIMFGLINKILVYP